VAQSYRPRFTLLANNKFISGLVLGAGASSRFGQPKQLMPFNGDTLLGWIVARVLEASGLDEVVVVLGRAAQEIRCTVDFRNAKVVENPVFGEGCASSYRAGIAALDPRAEALMIILGDQPGVTPDIINSVAAHWRTSQSEIVLSSYRGRRGHPMIFSKKLFGDLLGLHGDKAAWKLVDSHQQTLSIIEFDRRFPEDVNTKENLDQLLAEAGCDGRE
jgi:molybdenum cofactor cytidylyltransferase